MVCPLEKSVAKRRFCVRICLFFVADGDQPEAGVKKEFGEALSTGPRRAGL